MDETLILIKLSGSNTGVFWDAKAVAEFLLDADETQAGIFGPAILAAKQKLAEGVAKYSAEHGVSGPLPRGTLIEILVQLLPVILQLLPTLLALCPK